MKGLRAFKNQPLQPERLVDAVRNLIAHPAENIRDLKMRIVRTGRRSGVILKVWTPRGARPELYQDPSYHAFVIYDGKHSGGVSGTDSPRALRDGEKWAEFIEAANAALALPEDRELMIRVNLRYSP